MNVYLAAKNYFRSSKKRKVLFLASLVAMVLGTMVFAKLVDDYLGREGLFLVDKPIAAWVVSTRTPLLNRLMILITLTGNWQMIILGITIVSIVLVLSHKWRYFWVLLITSGVAEVFVESSKLLIQRIRPPHAEALIPQFSYSFPSGHSYFASVYYGLLAYIWIRHLKDWRLRISMAIGGGAFILLLGFSRVYLGVHWATDVIAGLAIGGAWLGAMVLFLEIENMYYKEKEMRVKNKKEIYQLMVVLLFGWLLALGIAYQNQIKRAVNLGINTNIPIIRAVAAAIKTAPAARSRA